MKREEIFKIVREIIDDKIGAFEPIKEEHYLKGDLGFDSLDDVEFIMECERLFEISIPDEDVDRVETIKDVLDYLQTKIK